MKVLERGIHKRDQGAGHASVHSHGGQPAIQLCVNNVLDSTAGRLAAITAAEHRTILSARGESPPAAGKVAPEYAARVCSPLVGWRHRLAKAQQHTRFGVYFSVIDVHKLTTTDNSNCSGLNMTQKSPTMFFRQTC